VAFRKLNQEETEAIVQAKIHHICALSATARIKESFAVYRSIHSPIFLQSNSVDVSAYGDTDIDVST